MLVVTDGYPKKANTHRYPVLVITGRYPTEVKNGKENSAVENGLESAVFTGYQRQWTLGHCYFCPRFAWKGVKTNKFCSYICLV